MAFPLEKLDGPACPKCGCRDCPIVPARAGMRWGQQYVHGRPVAESEGEDEPLELPPLRRCGHCRATFRAADPQPADAGEVIHVRLRCPHCNSDRHRVTRTIGDVRYHKCAACELPFKSRTI